MKWGAAVAQVRFGDEIGDEDGIPDEYIDNLFGFWITGDLPTVGSLPQTGGATYDGHTIGTVLERHGFGESNHWEFRTAGGDLHMTWNFAQRQGDLSITNFDEDGTYGPLNVSGQMKMPGVLSEINQFSGPLLGTLAGPPNNNNVDNPQFPINVGGSAAGSFARRGNDAAAGVIGNWHAGNNYYKATGIFGASRTP
jgi:hypothetical protein